MTEVLEGLLDGKPLDQLAQLITATQAAEVLMQVFSLLTQRAQTSNVKLALHLESRRRVYEKAMQIDHPAAWAVALRALQDAAKLEGLYDLADDLDDEEEVEDSPFVGLPTEDDLGAAVVH